jgi:hypothetical protein
VRALVSVTLRDVTPYGVTCAAVTVVNVVGRLWITPPGELGEPCPERPELGPDLDHDRDELGLA